MAAGVVVWGLVAPVEVIAKSVEPIIGSRAGYLIGFMAYLGLVGFPFIFIYAGLAEGDSSQLVLGIYLAFLVAIVILATISVVRCA